MTSKPDMTDTNKEREDFETFVRKRWGGSDRGGLTRKGSGYATGPVDFAWAAFQAGRASLAASAGSEPVAQPSDADAILSKICDLFHIGKLARTESTILTNIRNVIHFTGLLRAVERDLFTQPELHEDDDPYAEVDEGLPAPNSWAAKDEVDYVAQFRAALAARGFTHPSPPEGAGWRPIATAPEGQMVVVGWLDLVDTEHPERHDFDLLEDGCWQKWHDHAEHVEVIGGHGVSYTPPYTVWMPVGQIPAPPASEAKGASK